MARVGISSAVVSRVTGLSLRRLDHWCWTGIISPSVDSGVGRGHGRRWSLDDVTALLALRDLRKAGCSLQRLRKVQAKLRELGEGDLRAASIYLAFVPELRDDVLLARSQAELTSLVTKPGQRVLAVVDVGARYQDVARDVARIESIDTAKSQARREARRAAKMKAATAKAPRDDAAKAAAGGAM